MFRANVFQHVSKYSGAGLYEAHEEIDSRSTRQSGGIHRQRVSATADVRSSRRRVFVVRAGSREQNPDRLRADGVLRHVESLRSRCEGDSEDAAVARLATASRWKLEAGYELHQ